MCLKFADEYQAGNVVSQCLAEVNLTNENVFAAEGSTLFLT
jgi:hypothetical protein